MFSKGFFGYKMVIKVKTEQGSLPTDRFTEPYPESSYGLRPAWGIPGETELKDHVNWAWFCSMCPSHSVGRNKNPAWGRDIQWVRVTGTALLRYRQWARNCSGVVTNRLLLRGHWTYQTNQIKATIAIR